MNQYQFQLLRCMPNVVSGEFYNVGVFLYDGDARLIDARFTPDFRRLRCHPLVDLHYLECLRQEFEEKLLAGEGFSHYVSALQQDLSNALQVTEPKAFVGKEPSIEIDRLVQSYLATPVREDADERDSEPLPGSRRALRGKMNQVFRRFGLIGGNRLASQVSVTYGGSRLRFTFDYGYQPNGGMKYLHALGLRDDVSNTSKLCFVFERLCSSADKPAALTAVVDDSFPDDTRHLLESASIATCPASSLDGLAMEIRRELGL